MFTMESTGSTTECRMIIGLLLLSSSVCGISIPSVMLRKISEPFFLVEGQASAAYQVELSSAPDTIVTIHAFAVGPELAVNRGNLLHFNATTYNVPQYVHLTGVEDDTMRPPIYSAGLELQLSSIGDEYSSQSVSLQIPVKDNDIGKLYVVKNLVCGYSTC